MPSFGGCEPGPMGWSKRLGVREEPFGPRERGQQSLCRRFVGDLIPEFLRVC
jgi:hypothetical protein